MKTVSATLEAAIKKRVLSWGCGTQSTALVVMSALGDFGLPRLDAVFHSDLGWECERTYEIQAFYSEWLAAHGIRVFIVDGGDIREDGAKSHVHIPFWTVSGSPLTRQCTQYFKIRPIRRAVRAWLSYGSRGGVAPPAGLVEQWIGFSADEARRCRGSGVRYIVNRFPLVEMGFDRQDSIDYLSDKGLPVPVLSSCIGCPYRRASEYLEMKSEDLGEFDQACEFDETNRKNPLAHDGVESDEVFIWRGAVPLADVDLKVEAERERAVLSGRQMSFGLAGCEFRLKS